MCLNLSNIDQGRDGNSCQEVRPFSHVKKWQRYVRVSPEPNIAKLLSIGTEKMINGHFN